MTRTLTRIGTAWVFAMLQMSAGSAWAQTESFAKPGAYVGFLASPGTTFKGGSFDGVHYLYDSDQLVLIPHLSSADGLGFVVGGRFETGAIELTYVQADHPAAFAGASGVARTRVVNLDGKRFFLPSTRVQPYFTGGLAIPWLVVEEGAASRTGGGDATFVGVGFNVGGGVAVYVHPRVALSAGYSYRLVVFPRVKGAAGSFVDIDAKAQPVGRNGNMTASVSFAF